MNTQEYIDAIIEHSIVQEFALLGLIDRLIKDGIFFDTDDDRGEMAAKVTAESQKAWDNSSPQERADLMAIAKESFELHGITLEP
jgi:hypothetical protein